MSKIVRYSLDLDNLPPLTETQKAELAALKDRPIDYSDIPQLTDRQIDTAVHGRFYRPIKTTATVRVDADVIAWLKSQGKGYQTRLNAILRDAMLQSMRKAA